MIDSSFIHRFQVLKEKKTLRVIIEHSEKITSSLYLCFSYYINERKRCSRIAGSRVNFTHKTE